MQQRKPNNRHRRDHLKAARRDAQDAVRRVLDQIELLGAPTADAERVMRAKLNSLRALDAAAKLAPAKTTW
jgi:hypothetical protein